MTPEELDCIRAAVAAGIPMDSGELGRMLLEHIDQQAEEIKRREAENYQWRSYNHELGNKSHKQRLALKKLGEKVRARGKALVKERARRLVAAGAECFFRTPIKGSILSKCDKGIYCDWTTCPIKDEKRQDAREQLRAEGVIR